MFPSVVILLWVNLLSFFLSFKTILYLWQEITWAIHTLCHHLVYVRYRLNMFREVELYKMNHWNWEFLLTIKQQLHDKGRIFICTIYALCLTVVDHAILLGLITFLLKRQPLVVCYTEIELRCFLLCRDNLSKLEKFSILKTDNNGEILLLHLPLQTPHRHEIYSLGHYKKCCICRI